MLHPRSALAQPRDLVTPDHFLPSDRLPVPEPVVRDSEDAWMEFQRLLGLAGPAAPIAPRPAQPLTVHDVMVEARRFNRVCPLPAAWQRLYDLLPGKRVTGREMQPPPPISGHAWLATSAMPKRMCLRDHIEWAERQGALEAVMQFLKVLPESQWHHVGDAKRA